MLLIIGYVVLGIVGAMLLLCVFAPFVQSSKISRIEEAFEQSSGEEGESG